MEASEGLRTQIGLQKQLHDQLEVCTFYSELVREEVRAFTHFTNVGSLVFPSPQIQRKLQLQVEEHSKYLEKVIAKQGESLKLLGALPRFQLANTPAVGQKEAYREQTTGTNSAEGNHPEKE
jgi:hypothetical protein